jgi:5'-3' exonuclease
MLLLVDYSSLLYRAFFSMPEHLPAHAVHGFLNMLAPLIADHRPQRLAIAVDDDWRPAFRVEAIPSYKTHRVAEGGDDGDEEEDLIGPQETLGRELLAAMGFAVVGADGFEADDVIATLVATSRGRIEILSGDRDLFALVRDPDVRVLYPRRGTTDLAFVDEAEVTRRYDIPGRTYQDFALLRGDPSDGLPGARGIGEKTAAKLMRDYGSLDAVLRSTELPPAIARKIDASRDYLEAARRVIPPLGNVPLTAPDLSLPRSTRQSARVSRIAAEHELTHAIERVQAALRHS